MVHEIEVLPVHASQLVTWYECNMTNAVHYVPTVEEVDQRDTRIAYGDFTTKVTVCESYATFNCALTPKTRLWVEIPIHEGRIVMEESDSEFYRSDLRLKIRNRAPASQNDHDLYFDIVEQVLLEMTPILEQLRPLVNEIDFFVKCVDLTIYEGGEIGLYVESLEDAPEQVRAAAAKSPDLFEE